MLRQLSAPNLMDGAIPARALRRAAAQIHTWSVTMTTLPSGRGGGESDLNQNGRLCEFVREKPTLTRKKGVEQKSEP